MFGDHGHLRLVTRVTGDQDWKGAVAVGAVEQLVEKAHRTRRVGEGDDADGFDGVVGLVLSALVVSYDLLAEDYDQVGGDFEEGLVLVEAQWLDGFALFWGDAAVIEGLLLFLSAAPRIFPLSTGFEMVTKCQGCCLAPLGAVPTANRAFSIMALGTGRSLKSRTLRRLLTSR